MSNRPPARTEHFLKPRRRSTPCIGICSTSHGDHVCRGCKRFFNEVRDWQSFDADQREMVMNRLADFKRRSVRLVVDVANEAILTEKTNEYVEADSDDTALRLYEALARCRGNFVAWGIMIRSPSNLSKSPEEILRSIEDEYYQMSKSFFYRFFKVPPS